MSKVAAIQMCSSDAIDTNLKIAGKFIHEAADNGAQLIVLPEMFAIMGLTPKNISKTKEAFGKGPIQDFLAEQALKNQAWIVGGTIPIAANTKNKINASTLIFNQKGNVEGYYNKINLFNAKISEQEIYCESDTTEPGNRTTVIETPFGKLGLAVCFDIRFPELFIQLRQDGAEIIALPSAFTAKTGVAHWHLLTRARATENFCYLIGAAQGGEHNCGRKTYGHSLIVDPWGTIIQEFQKPGNGIVYGDINLNYVNQVRGIFNP